jgi:hydrogenase nickel incorporation protein HypA/HybF
VHEQALIDDLVREIEEVAMRAGSTRVTRIRVRLGALAHLTPEHFGEHFELAANGTVAECATIDIEESHDPLEPDAAEIVLTSVDVEES